MRRVAASLAGLLLIALLALTHAASEQPPLRAQDPGPIDSVISPLASGWSLLVNLGPDADPAALLAPIDEWVDSAFTFNAGDGTFAAYRAGRPTFSDLDTITSGQVFWAFAPPDRLEGDLTFWEQAAVIRHAAQSLVPGFNLVPWTGSDGVRISDAVAGLPVQRAYRWDALGQRFVVWNPILPDTLHYDFALEYGEGLWIDLAGDEPVVWEQP